MKLKYKVNKNNQLIIIRGKESLYPEGRFTLVNNQLIYEVRESRKWRDKNNIPKRIILEGEWSIDKDHNITFTLRKTQTQAGGEKLFLKTELIAAKSNALIISCSTKGRSGTHTIHLLQLKGRWQADEYNRLQFLVKNQAGTLTLKGVWEVKNNSLIYTYKRTAFKKKKIHRLRFKGIGKLTDETG